MLWLRWTYRALQRVRAMDGRLWPVPVLLALVGMLSVAGCASPAASSPPAQATASAAGDTPALHFILDGNFIAAKSAHDLRYTLMALSAKDGHVAWRHALAKQSPADAPGADYPPVSRDGLVYVGYYYDHADDPQNVVRYSVVEALEAATGKLRWRRELGGGFEFAGELVVDGATVYASLSAERAQGQPLPAESGMVKALDVQSGKVRWQRALQDTPSMVASADGRVFVMASQQFGGHLFALNASDGSVAWDYVSDAPLSRGGDAQNGPSNAPTVVGGRVYAQATERNADGTANLKLLALNAGDGSVAWQRQTGGIAATPAFNQSGDTLCLSAYDTVAGTSTILGLAASSGTARWSITAMQGVVSGCAASGDAFYLAQRSSNRQTGSVFALSSQDGRQLWKYPAGPPVAADGLLAPTAVDGIVGVYLAASSLTQSQSPMTMTLLRASDGRLLWRRDVNMRPDQVPDIRDDVIVIPAIPEGQPGVTVYARETGTMLWSYAIGHL